MKVQDRAMPIDLANSKDWRKAATIPDAKFREQLEEWLTDPPFYPQLVKITPVMAAIMLERNPLPSENGDNPGLLQRSLTPHRRRRAAKAVEAGKVKATNTMIAFNQSGYLQDGQTRLHACVDTGLPIVQWLVFGQPDGYFSVIDLPGSARTAGDIFQIHGVRDASAVAAVVRSILVQKRGGVRGRSGGFAEIDSHEDLYRLYLELGPDKVAESVVMRNKLKRKRIPQPTPLGALHYLCAERNRAMADDFFSRLASGEEMKPREPVRRLRDRLLMERDLPFHQIVADAVLAWNATRRRQPLKWYVPGDSVPGIA